MMLTHRLLEDADFPQCLALLRPEYGFEDALLARLPELWHSLSELGAGNSAVVEDAKRPPGKRIIAFGVSVFAAPEFLRAFHSHPQPYLARRVLDAWLAGSRPFLTFPEIAAANSGDGLTLLILHSIYSPEIIADEPFHRMARTMMEAFLDRHSGYRLQQLVSECYGAKRLGMHLGGGWQLRTDFADYFARQDVPVPSPEARPYLVEMTRAEALTNPGYAVSTLFTYTPPCFSFRRPEQVLLQQALKGGTDEELAAFLGISLSAVKNRWRAIYDRASEILPDLLPFADSPGREQARGTEKRRRLLDYLRHHPEELRPALPPPARGGSSRQRNA